MRTVSQPRHTGLQPGLIGLQADRRDVDAVDADGAGGERHEAQQGDGER